MIVHTFVYAAVRVIDPLSILPAARAAAAARVPRRAGPHRINANGKALATVAAMFAALLLAAIVAGLGTVQSAIVGVTSDIEGVTSACVATWQHGASIVHEANAQHKLKVPLRFSVDAQEARRTQHAEGRR